MRSGSRYSVRDRPQDDGSGGLAFVKRERSHVRVVLDTAAARAGTRLRHYIAHRLFALAAARSDAELELQLVERVDALCDRGTNFPVGHRLAHANDHGDTR